MYSVLKLLQTQRGTQSNWTLHQKKIIEFGFAWYHAEPHQIIVYCFAVGLHSVPGGVFPVPPVAAHLMTLLPPPSCFQVVYCRLVVHSLNLFILVFLVTMFPPITWLYFLHINAQTTHNSSIRSEKGLMLETSALKHLMMANLHYQHSQ